MAAEVLRGGLRNAHGERLDHAFVRGRDDRVVVIGHGLTSAKDRPWSIALADALAAAGIGSLRFSFAGNGGSEGAFADATISKEVEDLGSVLDALGGRRIAYAGHSMGGAVGVLRAARDARIRALVSLAGMVHVAAFMRRLFGHLQPGRDVMLDKPGCPLTQGFLDDAARIGTVLEPGQRIAAPFLLVHGTADELVPVGDSRAMRAASGAELIELDGVDHRFTGHEAEMAARVVDWLCVTWR
jgi:pimeloyl-ACP methyl ester carboxylesterase